MRPTLESLQVYYSKDVVEEAQRQREAYAKTPIEVRRLFTKVPIELETDAWLVFAWLAGETSLIEVPNWVSNLVTIWVPTIECYPSKSPGAWRFHANQSEWYHYF